MESKKVDVFIGYRKGTVAMMNEPVLIQDPGKVGLLHWDSNCGLNLCNYLTKRTEKIGIVANGCNSRNIVTHHPGESDQKGAALCRRDSLHRRD